MGQDLKDSSDDAFSFSRPEDLGLSGSESSYEEIFMTAGSAKKGNDRCPVCGSMMVYKEKVDSYYCSKCRSFY